MNDLGERFERLGLSQYLEAFIGEGFDTWDTVLDITESDLNSLHVKLGHRRKLQRAIAESRGHTSDRPLPITLGRGNSGDGQYRSDDSSPESKAKQPDTSTPGAAGTSTKRKYRRHPKPDEHAPERPPSAYVIFSNQVRESLKGQELSFTEIAKVVGERWQVLHADAREACERQANTAKEKYYAELAEYKKTPQYEAYQKYLEDFKAKHAAPQKDGGKRSKLETETSTSTRSSSHEQGERMPPRRVSSAQSDPLISAQPRIESSPPINATRLPSYPSYGSKSNSPATHSTSLNSPRATDHYSPMSASPRSATVHKEASFDAHPNPLSRDSRERHSDPSLPMVPSIYGQQHQPAATTSPSHSYSTHYQTPIDLPSRRSFREPVRLPPLTHEDTTLSSESGYSSTSYSQSQPMLPVMDASKSLRFLPQPVPSGESTSNTLHRPLPPSTAPSQQPNDPRSTSSLAALLRASELARVADDEVMADKEVSP